MPVNADHDGHKDQHQGRCAVDGAVQRLEQIAQRGALLGMHQEGADQGGDQAHSCHQEGQDDAGPIGHEDAQRGGRNDRAAVALEQVGAHAGHVAHVVAHVVGDHGRVAGIVLRDAELDLAHQVGAHVSRFGVDAAPYAREQGDGAGAKAEAGDVLDVAVEEDVEQGHAQQAEADHSHTHHRAAAEGHPQAFVQAATGGCGGAHIGPYGYVHTQITGCARCDGAGDEGDGCLPVEEDGDDNRYHRDESGEEGILPLQESRRAFLDGVGDLPHLVGACVMAQDAAQLHGHKSQAHDGDGKYEDDA
jgi:hypothetical protein